MKNIKFFLSTFTFALLTVFVFLFFVGHILPSSSNPLSSQSSSISNSSNLNQVQESDEDGESHGNDKTQIKKILLTFQKNWDEGKVSSYLLWLPVFDIKEVKLNQNQVVPVDALANAIQSMLTAEKFDFTKLQGEAKKQLLSLLNAQGKLREVETFQDDVWKQIKNHQKWRVIGDSPVYLFIQLFWIEDLLLKVQDLGISKISHPFFPEGYDLSFLQDNPDWEKAPKRELLQGMKVVVNGTYVEFQSHLFPNKVVFQVPMKKLSTVFSKITITNIITTLKKAISDYSQQKKNLESKPSKENNKIPEEKNKEKKSNISNNEQKSNISNNNLTIGLSIAGGTLALSALGGFLFWSLKIKK